MDMLEVGRGLTEDEDRSHFAAWAMLASPLILGNDVRKMSDATKRILTNKDVIAINQDKLGIQAWRFMQSGQLEYWAKPLDNGEWAVMVLNRSEQAMPVSYQWSNNRVNDDMSKRVLDTTKTVFNWTDAWTGKTGDTTKKLESKLAPHAAIVLRLKPRS